jgi:hypothetical protein
MFMYKHYITRMFARLAENNILHIYCQYTRNMIIYFTLYFYLILFSPLFPIFA